MKRLFNIIALASMLLACQTIHGVESASSTSSRIQELKDYIMFSTNPQNIVADEQELQQLKNNKTWAARKTRILNWIKRNPGKSILIGTVAAAGLAYLGYRTYTHFTIPQPTITPTTPNLCSHSALSNLRQEVKSTANTCTIATQLLNGAENCILASTSKDTTQQCTTVIRDFAEIHKAELPNFSQKIAQLSTVKPLILQAQECVTALPVNAPIQTAFTCLSKPFNYAQTNKLPALQQKVHELSQGLALTYAQSAKAMLSSYTPTESSLDFVRRIKVAAQKVVDFAVQYKTTAPEAEQLLQEMSYVETSWLARTTLVANSLIQQAGGLWNSIIGCVSHPITCTSSVCKTVSGLFS